MTQPEELIRLLLDQADENAFVFLDADGKIVEWFRGAEQIYGYTRDEMFGTSGEVLFTPESRVRGTLA